MKIEKIYRKAKKAVKHGLKVYETINEDGNFVEIPGRDVEGFHVEKYYGYGWASSIKEITVSYKGSCVFHYQESWSSIGEEYSPSIKTQYAGKIWNLG